jgi:cobalt-zinc-cadmium efflux system protein
VKPDMPHDHEHHDPAAARSGQTRRLGVALALAAAYMLAEVIGGLLSNSLALLADAGHMVSDAAALGLSLFAVWIAAKDSPTQRTFGYYRAEILAALANAAVLIAAAIVIAVEAWQRLKSPEAIQSTTMLVVACGGLVVNFVMLWILHGGRDASLNIRGAWLHVWSDTLGSLGVIVAAVCLQVFGWLWVDPVASLLISVLIIHSSWSLLRDAVSVLMESAPTSIPVQDVRGCLLAEPGVRGVHCLHVWTITTGLHSVSAHVVVEESSVTTGRLRQLQNAIASQFPVEHITLQLEPEITAYCDEQPLEACRPAQETSSVSP